MVYMPVSERRKEVIRAAIDVIASEGLERTTTRRIAERAGVPLGALHYCFKNKDEVLEGIKDVGTCMLREAFSAVDPSEGLEATIRNDIEALWNWYQENIWLQFALTEMGMRYIRQGAQPSKVYAMWGPWGRDIVQSHLDAAQKHDKRKSKIPIKDIVRFILHRFDGLTLEYAASQDLKACQRQVDLLTEAIVWLALGGSGVGRENGTDRRSRARVVSRRESSRAVKGTAKL